MTNIQWTDVTENPIAIKKPDGSHGGHWCHKISAGCANCYAEKLNSNPGFFSFASKLPYTGDVPDGLTFDFESITRWKRARTSKKRFICSMTDLFGEWVPIEWQLMIFDAAEGAPKQTIQLLTKRPEIALSSARRWLETRYRESLPSNIWMGVTIEDEAAERARFTPLYDLSMLSNTWISYEPALTSVDFKKLAQNDMFSWIVVGGESGAKARPCDVRSLIGAVQTAKEYDIPVFVKQMGQNPVYDGKQLVLRDRKGGDFLEFPKELQYREFPI
jgi:protein gp37